jgi:hypothetical protein
MSITEARKLLGIGVSGVKVGRYCVREAFCHFAMQEAAMRRQVCERFVETSPLSVRVRASLARVLGADRLALWYERTAQQP